MPEDAKPSTGHHPKMTSSTGWPVLSEAGTFQTQRSTADHRLGAFHSFDARLGPGDRGCFGCLVKRCQKMMEKKTKTTLPETNSSPMKMDGWNTSFLLGWPSFRGYVSFRECIMTSWNITIFLNRRYL